MPNYLLQWTMSHLGPGKRDAACMTFGEYLVFCPRTTPCMAYIVSRGFNGDLVEFVGEWDKVYSPFFLLAVDQGLTALLPGS